MLTQVQLIGVLQLVYLSGLYSVYGQEVNLIEQIHNQVKASQSSTWCTDNDCWIASRGIDFNEDTIPKDCACCAGPHYSPSWWNLDLGNVYSIKTIIYIGRSDYTKQSRNFVINKVMDGNLDPIYQSNASSNTSFEINLDPPVALQILNITHSRDAISVCELKLIESDYCPVPYFDRHCNQTCHCFDKQPCNKTSGICQSPGCEAGWKGASCNEACGGKSFGTDCSFDCHCNAEDMCNSFHGDCLSGICAPGWMDYNCSIPCGQGTFGQNCSFICHCKNNVSCNHTSGECDTCAPGWQDQNCSIGCDWGSFGEGCSDYCYCYDNASCERFTGVCSNGLCATGYRTSSCSEKCESGTFGQNCSLECHCLNNEDCSHVSGSCAACAPGWQGETCSVGCDWGSFGDGCSHYCHCYENASCDSVTGICFNGICENGYRTASCSEKCESGTFGQNCNFECHCLNKVDCSLVNGSCDACAPGWQGETCSAELLSETEPAPSTALIIGPVVGVLIFAAAIAAVILYRRRFRKNTSEVPVPSNHDFTEIHKSTPASREVENEVMASAQSNEKEEFAEKQEDHTYYSYNTKENTILVQKLWDYISQAYESNCAKMHLEFQKLPSGLIHNSAEASRPENIRKNRYRGIVAYDHTRVKLQRDDPSESTYVNACYIDGYTKPKKFIASQGPQENTSGDFCEMIYQQNVSMIVMLTNAIELGSKKCVQYWPSSKDEELKFGDEVITIATTATFPDYTIRELNFSKARQKPHRITQVHFTAWPDKDVPDSPWHLVNVWRKVNSLTGNMKEPIVVHCSAGVGRTGTFIALDNLYAQARSEGYIQPLDAITKLRNQRVNMVQTKDQYVFVHEAVAEALYLGVKATKIQDFDAVYKSLSEKDDATGQIGLEQQFLFLQKVKAESDDEYCNVHLARELDAYRPTPSADANKDDFIFLQNYTGKDTFIVMKMVDSSTISQEILNVVRRNKIKTVISLSVESGKSKQAVCGGEDGNRKPGKNVSKRQNSFLEKTIKVEQHKSKQGNRQVKQFEFLMWKNNARIPSAPDTVIKLLNAVQRWQPAADENHPVLVTCESGHEKSGLICALLSEFERIRVREEVNLLATVKAIKQKNPQFIPNYDQYKFCHSAVLEYIRQSDVYMNIMS